MVDPYQVLIDNGSCTSTNSDTPKLSTILTQNMNEPETSTSQQQPDGLLNSIEVIKRLQLPNESDVTANESDVTISKNEINKIMCGPSSIINHGTNTGIVVTTNDTDLNNSLNVCNESDVIAPVPVQFQNGLNEVKHLPDIRTINKFDANSEQESVKNSKTNVSTVCAILNKANQLNDTNETVATDNFKTNKSTIVINVVPEETRSTSLSTNIDPIDRQNKIESQLSESTINPIITDTELSLPEMDSRKVEPLRININREPIKTKIKLGQQSQPLGLLASNTKYASLSTNVSDEVDNVANETPQVFPKITIKPIVKPPEEDESQPKDDDDDDDDDDYDDSGNEKNHRPHHHHHHHHHHHQYQHQHGSSNHHSQEAIPKLKIKVDSTSSSLQNLSSFSMTSSSSSNRINSSIVSQSANSGSDDTQPLSEPYIVPKTIRSSKNLSIGSNNGGGECGSTSSVGTIIANNEIVPKFTIKLDNHQHNTMQQNSASNKEVSLVSDEGVKVTLKPLSEPPLPKLTIKTNAMNDTAEVVMVNNAMVTTSIPSVPKITIKTMKQSNLSSDVVKHLTNSQPLLSQQLSNINPSTRSAYSPNTISSTSSISSYSAQNAEDNLSTCSSGSASSFSSNSSATGPNDDIKLIIKATSTGSCVVNANTASVIRNSPSTKNTTTGLKLNSKTISSTMVEQSKVNNSGANTSTTEAIPKLNIKLSNTDYPQLIQVDDDKMSQRLCTTIRTNSPIQKTANRSVKSTEENIVIPKVTIKPPVDPNDDSDIVCIEPPLVTPKIILKPIPKPIDKPLEIITAPSSPFSRSAENESQQSPRIILKINKNATSQTTEAILLTKPSTSLSSPTVHASDDSSRTTQINLLDLQRTSSPTTSILQNELKRTNYEAGVKAKKLKLTHKENANDDDDDDDDDVVHLLSSDSEPDALNHKDFSLDSDKGVDLQTNSITTTASLTESPSTITTGPNIDTNSGLRSILSRPQMKILPPLQTFVQNIPTFNTTATTSDIIKNSDVIDLCYDSNDHMLSGNLLTTASIDSNTTSTSTELNTSITATTSIPSLTNSSQNNSKSDGKTEKYKWPFFYGVEEEKQKAVHPLLQQYIERANVLEAMMNADNNLEKNQNQNHTANGSNSNSTPNDHFDKSVKKKGDLLLDHDGSSSDCIVIEDTASEPFPFGSGSDKVSEQNGQKKDSVDRDSGVDVSSSIKSISGDGHDDEATPVKRPRGRPRKDGTPAGRIKKQINDDLAKRKFAGVLMSQHNARATTDVSVGLPHLILPQLATNVMSNIIPPPTIKVTDNINVNANHQVFSGQQTTILTASGTMTITSTTAPTTPHTLPPPTITEATENKISIVPIDPIILNESKPIDSVAVLSPDVTTTFTSTVNDISAPAEEAVSVLETSLDATSPLSSATSSNTLKERKRRIVIDDDDESPTFNPLARGNKKMRGKGRANRGRGGLLKNQRKINLLSSPEKSRDSNVFTSPEGIDQNRRKFLIKDATTSALQVFEEDTRMSADSLFTSSNRNSEFLQNDESQSSLQSSISATIEGSARKIRSKIEVVDPDGKTEFTVDMIAEYDWPPPKGCCPARNRDTFMVQEQIAEYLGVKSFKRKYPDLQRRMVEMEERNYLMEKGMVSEKMCDLGLTAVLASDVLDIMHTDFYDKYEEYKKFLRVRQIRDLAARHKNQQADAVGKNLTAREKAMRAASSWNSSFNKSRKENRRECLDLQNLVVQIPEVARNQLNRPISKPSNYPVALVPGQFQEYYRNYSAAELLCYPLNTVIAEPYQLDRKLREYYNKSHHIQSDSDQDSDDDSDSGSSCSDSSGSSDDSSDSSSSSSSDSSSDEAEEEEDEKKPLSTIDGSVVTTVASEPTVKRKPLDKKERAKCRICSGSERCNPNSKPEVFVQCSICQRNAHPSCIKMPPRMVKRVNEYAWQCSDCKHCIKCKRTEDSDKMLYCDQCDRKYHIYCIGLRKVPNGQWHCAVCTVCTMCGARRPEGHNNPNLTPQQKQKLLAVAKWTHEYHLNQITNLREHTSMLCTSCVAIKHSAAKNIYFN